MAGAYFQPFKNTTVIMYLPTNSGMTDLSDADQTASNGVEVYRLADDKRYHCVIMDSAHPGYGKIGGGAASAGYPVVGILANSFKQALAPTTVCVSGIMPVVISEAINAGQAVYANADGTVGLTATNVYVGVAMTSGTVANELIAVLLKN